jgi:hypothetical protein
MAGEGQGADQRKCSLDMCPHHSHTLERVAILEKGMEAAEAGINKAVKRLDEVRDLTIDELKIIRDSIMEGILKRHSSTVMAIISILTGLCCALATALFILQ